MSIILNIFKGLTLHEILILIFFMIPSNALMFYFALKFLGNKTVWQKIFVSGVIFGILNLVFRKVFVHYGISMGLSVLSIALLFMLTLAFYHKLKVSKAILATLVCYILIFMGSPLSLKVVAALKVTTEQVFSSVFLNSLLGYTEDIFLILATIIVSITGYNIKKL